MGIWDELSREESVVLVIATGQVIRRIERSRDPIQAGRCLTG
jgi:hypothetical protein